jgi:hypothetical protein
MASIINASSTGSGGIVQTADASGVLQLQSNGTTALTVSGSTVTLAGATTLSNTLQVATTIGVGGATPAASGAGITFPATQSASSNANTLDDYEEGTWTPNLGGNDQGSSGGTGNVYSTRVGTYVKVGKIVTCTVNLVLSTASGNTGVVIFINGWPFNPDATSNAGLYVSLTWLSFGASYVNMMGYFNPGQANLHVIGATSASTSLQNFVPPSQLSNSSGFAMTFTYITT